MAACHRAAILELLLQLVVKGLEVLSNHVCSTVSQERFQVLVEWRMQAGQRHDISLLKHWDSEALDGDCTMMEGSKRRFIKSLTP